MPNAISYHQVVATITTASGNKIKSLIQSVTFNYAFQVEPLLELGTRANTPFAAFPSVSVQLRGVVVKADLSYQQQSGTNKVNIAVAGKGITKLNLGEVYNILFDLKNNYDIQANNCVISSLGRTIQAGSVLIYEDISLECESMQFKKQQTT